ncbi:MAG: HEAT repeat domain-containing protein [Peptococcaceae bacterium]|nr:HEAT repeat domain-containing protein [Peptococcaceae bacterium]
MGTEQRTQELSTALAAVFLEEWGGPRSPLALQYLHETIIPNLEQCFSANRDLWSNPTFLQIIDWKLRNQYGYPQAVSINLAEDLMQAARALSMSAQRQEPDVPWRRIFRLWFSGESLPNIAEKKCFPLEYLDLLQLRWKMFKKFAGGRAISIEACLQNAELREFGQAQLDFFCRFYTLSSNDHLFCEKLALEELVEQIGLPMTVEDYLALLEVVHANEGKLAKTELVKELRNIARNSRVDTTLNSEQDQMRLLAELLNILVCLNWLQENKAGKLTLSEKSAGTIAGFLLPKLARNIIASLTQGDLSTAASVYRTYNPTLQERLVEILAQEFNSPATVDFLSLLFKQVSRKVDMHIVVAMGRLDCGFKFLVRGLADSDSLVRATVCSALGNLSQHPVIPLLIQQLQDPVALVRLEAVKALGKLEANEAKLFLSQIADDYTETAMVRESALTALQAIQA